jgi:hypothetical protein
VPSLVLLIAAMAAIPAIAQEISPPVDQPGQPEAARPADAPGDQSSGSNVPKNQRPHLIELTAKNWRPLSNKEKFALFSRDLLYWETHASLAIGAAISTGINDRPFLDTGWSGYFQRYGFNALDETNHVFFQAYLFPSIFHEDPRYIPCEQGTTGERMRYALTRVIATRSDEGSQTWNRSKLLGTLVSEAVSDLYYSPMGRDTGIGGTFANTAVDLGSEAAFNLLKEFGPDIARRAKMNVWLRDLIRSALRSKIKLQ